METTNNSVEDADSIMLYDTATKVAAAPEIETFDLVPLGHPALSMVMPEFDFATATINPVDFASSLVETCRKYRGLGLSANQCGFEHRVFVMGHDTEYVAYFNPKVVAVVEDDGLAHMEEGCLSFPMLNIRITRPKTIDVEYQDYNGQKQTKRFSGITARCFLHELDHMNGIVYTNRVKPLAMQFGLKKLDKMKQRFGKQMKAYAKTLKQKSEPKTTKLTTAQQLIQSFYTNGNKETNP
jgi:peptide deformylase